MMQDESDSSLVRRARRGDVHAFEALVRRHMTAAYAVALAGVGEPSDAEDVCQDALIIALERLEQCRNPDRFAAWLTEIVRNRAHNFRRYRKVRETLPLEAADRSPGPDSPLRDAENGELRERMVEALDALTEKQREVVLMYDWEGWRHADIAERLGMSEGAARVHLHNARQALRARLAPRSTEQA